MLSTVRNEVLQGVVRLGVSQPLALLQRPFHQHALHHSLVQPHHLAVLCRHAEGVAPFGPVHSQLLDPTGLAEVLDPVDEGLEVGQLAVEVGTLGADQLPELVVEVVVGQVLPLLPLPDLGFVLDIAMCAGTA